MTLNKSYYIFGCLVGCHIQNGGFDFPLKVCENKMLES